MRQLMSKEVLYEPLKELNDKASFIPMLNVAPSISVVLMVYITFTVSRIYARTRFYTLCRRQNAIPEST